MAAVPSQIHHHSKSKSPNVSPLQLSNAMSLGASSLCPARRDKHQSAEEPVQICYYTFTTPLLHIKVDRAWPTTSSLEEWWLTWQWIITIFNRRYVFTNGWFSIVMLVFRGVSFKHKSQPVSTLKQPNCPQHRKDSTLRLAPLKDGSNKKSCCGLPPAHDFCQKFCAYLN